MKKTDFVKTQKKPNKTGEKTVPLSRDEMRLLKKKKMRRKRKIRKIILSFLLSVCVAAVGIVLAFTVFFKISSVEITGNKKYPEKTVLKYSGIKTGDSLLRVNEEEIKNALKGKLPYIDGIEVEKKLPSKLILTVTETKELAAYPAGGRYILLDGNGKILNNKATLLKENIALIKGISDMSGKNGEVFSSKSKNKDVLLDLLKIISNSGLKGITQIDITKTADIVLKYDSRITVKLGNSDNLEKKIKKCKAVMEKENEINESSKGVLDLRSDTYSYFKAK